jgi:hypothetical protein
MAIITCCPIWASELDIKKALVRFPPRPCPKMVTG